MTTAILVVLVLGGVVLRLHQLGAAAFFTFDEELFVRPAHGYLYGRPDGNDHPPLGKLVLAIGMLLFGENPVGWRFSSAVIGLHNVFIAGWLGSELFGNRRAGAFAAAAVAADGFFLAYSRAGLLDGTLVCLVLWSVLAAARARTVLGVLESVVLVGLAATVKWSGAFAVFPAAATILALGKVPRATILLFGLFPLLHAVLWMAALGLTGRPNDPRALWEHAAQLFRHHQALGTRHNDLASPWYSWIALHHPIVVKLSHHGLRSRYASTVANLALWAVGTILVVGVPLAAGAAAGVGRIARRWPRAGTTRAVAWLLSTW
ncbi:MAG: glycosyltransferase family 39 protein, partial [Deltaproteobacteria bacterium]|nr:glycosyltransferase family 39 protein [Deltaproteobacteria bacterium]